MVIDSLKRFIVSQDLSATVWVAFSGGLDSHVLLHGLAHIRQHTFFQLKALHINHGLSPHAALWTLHCQTVCDQLDIPFHSEVLALSVSSGESLEEVARIARYQALESYLKKGDVLVSAHHQDDQAETLLLQLLRGAGPKGLSAMPEVKPLRLGYQARPFLNVSRAALEEYARLHLLSWIEDESNANPQFSRNFIRLHVLPLLTQHWPSATKTLARSAKQCAQSHMLLEGYLHKTLQQCMGKIAGTLSVSALSQLSANEQSHILRVWLQEQGASVPSAVKIAHIQSDVLQAGIDKMPCVGWGQWEVRRFRQAIYVLNTQKRKPPAQLEWEWQDVGQALSVEGLGVFTLTSSSLVSGRWNVRLRANNASCQLGGRTHRHSIKNLLQEWGVPTWERDVTPLVFVDDCLVMVPSYYVDKAMMRRYGVSEVIYKSF